MERDVTPGNGRSKKKKSPLRVLPSKHPPRDKGGRPSKRTPELVKALLKNIREGLPYELACNLAGVSYVGYRRWIKKASKPTAPPELVKFLNAVTEAEIEAEASLARKWLSHTDKDWRATRDYMGRRWPRRWSQRVEHTGAEGGPIAVQGVFIEVKGTTQEFVDALRQAREVVIGGRDALAEGQDGHGELDFEE